MSERRKFKILYPQDHPEKEKRGKPFLRREGRGEDMVVMNGKGIFFLFNGVDYYPSIRKLSDVLPKYDVVWSDE